MDKIITDILQLCGIAVMMLCLYNIFIILIRNNYNELNTLIMVVSNAIGLFCGWWVGKTFTYK